MARVGKQAPEFETIALVGEDFKTIKLSDYKGKLFGLVITNSELSLEQGSTWFFSSILWVGTDVGSSLALLTFTRLHLCVSY